jgi:hypothetical protein
MALAGRRRYRRRVAQAAVVYRRAVDLGDQERRLMDVKAVILLVGVDHRPFLGPAELDRLIDAIFVDGPAIDHEHLAVHRTRIHERTPVCDGRCPHLVDPPRALDTLAQYLAFGIARFRSAARYDQRQIAHRFRRPPGFVLEGDGTHGVFARRRPHCDRLDPLARADQKLGDLARLRQRVAVRGDHVERHAFDV